jgi:hypothetical protein
VVVTLIDVDPAQYEAASRVFGGELAAAVGAASKALLNAFDDCTVMAGGDAAGAAWSGSYDRVASATGQSLFDLEQSCVVIGSLLQQSGYNYGRAEAHSDVSGSIPLPPDRTTYSPAQGACVVFPSAAGGAIQLPASLSVASDLLETLWPDGDPAKLLNAAAAWNAAAAALDAAQRLVNDGVYTISSQNAPEIENALTVCQSLSGSLTGIAEQCRLIAKACEVFSTQVDQAQADVINEVSGFIEATMVIELAGAALAVETLGIGEVGAQVGEGFEVANLLTRVGAIATKLLVAARAEVAAVTAVTLDTVNTGLRLILSRVPILADTVDVGRGAATLDGLGQSLRSETWSATWSPRGFDVEAKMGGNLPPGFPTVDKWELSTGAVASIKSVDLLMPTYKNMANLASKLRGYVDKVAGFQGDRLSGVTIRADDITSRVLEVGIPPGASAEQMQVLEEVAKYAQTKGATMIWKEIP